LEEVRATRWGLERDPVADQCHGVRLVGADERVKVRAVDRGILRHQWCFTVARREARRRAQAGKDAESERGDGCDGSRRLAKSLAAVRQGAPPLEMERVRSVCSPHVRSPDPPASSTYVTPLARSGAAPAS